MQRFRRYLCYRLRGALGRMAAFLAVAVVFSQYTVYLALEERTVGFEMTTLLLGAFATVIPILETVVFRERKNLDVFYSFPMERKVLALAHYLSGWIQVVLLHTATLGMVWIVWSAASTVSIPFRYVVGYYLLSVLAATVVYSVVIFLFGQGNTVWDGLVFAGLWTVVLALAVQGARMALETVWHHRLSYDAAGRLFDWGFAYSPLFIACEHIEVLLGKSGYVTIAGTEFWSFWENYVGMAFWISAGIGAAVGYFVTFSKKAAHRVGEISDSWFGYRILIPMLGYSLLLWFGSASMLLSVMLLALMLLGYCAYRRSFRLRLSDLTVTACGILPILLVWFY